MGAIVRSRTENRQVSFLTNRHVAVDLDYPNQKMFHPLPLSLGPGVYLGAVERATSFITDELWHGIFAGTNPAAVQDQRNAIDYTIGESPHPERVPPKDEENFEPLNLNIQPVLVDGETQHPSFINRHFHIDGIETSPKVEHQFIPSFTGKSPMHQNNKQENLESRGIIMEAIL